MASIQQPSASKYKKRKMQEDTPCPSKPKQTAVEGPGDSRISSEEQEPIGEISQNEQEIKGEFQETAGNLSELNNAVEHVPEAPQTIEDLPDEILLKIFSYFKIKELSTVLARVDKRWRLLAGAKSLWPSAFKIEKCNTLVGSYLAVGGRNFRRVELYRLRPVDIVLGLVAKNCPELEELLFTSCESQNPDVGVGMEFPKVLALDFRFTIDNNNRRLASLLSKLGLPQLRFLAVPGALDEEHFAWLLAGKDKLTTLGRSAYFITWSDALFEVIVREVGATLRELRGVQFYKKKTQSLLRVLDMPNFQSLHVQLTANDSRDPRFQEKVMEPLRSIAHKLVSFELELMWDQHMTPVPTQELAELLTSGEFRNLKKFKFYLPERSLPTGFLETITSQLSGLESLLLFSRTSLGKENIFGVLATNCPNLVSLEVKLFGIQNIMTGVGIRRLLAANQFWENLRELKVDIPGFDKDHLLEVLRRRPGVRVFLEDVELSNC